MTDEFDDYDPEDAWDESDTLAEQLANLDHRISWFIEQGHGGIVDPLIVARVLRFRRDLREVTGRLVGALELLEATSEDSHPRSRRLPEVP